MDIVGILVIICIWTNGVTLGETRVKGGELHRVLTERAREMLGKIKRSIVTEPDQLQQSQETLNAKSSTRLMMGSSPSLRTTAFQQRSGSMLMPSDSTMTMDVTKVHPSFRAQKADNPARTMETAVEDDNKTILALFSEKLGKKDLANAEREIEESIKALSKANLLELKSMSKPHLLVEKTLSIICALRGMKQLNWNSAKELIGRSSFKVEQMQVNAKTMKSSDVSRAQQILTDKTNRILTPDNVQFHSEAAALLLIWAANTIKLYACAITMGIKPEEMQKDVLKMDNFQQISTRTKVAMKLAKGEVMDDRGRIVKECVDKDEEGVIKKASKGTKLDTNLDKDRQVIERERSPKNKQKKKTGGIFGKFLSTKKAEYDDNEFTVANTLVDSEKQKDSKMVDLSAIRRGLNFRGDTKKKQDVENEDISREQAAIEREKQLKNAAELHAQQEAEKKKKKKEEDIPPEGQQDDGKLTPSQVQNLPDDPDEIINLLKTLDYGKQDLEVLIDMSNQLKFKRMGLFQDQNYLGILQSAGLTPDKIYKQSNL